MRKQWFGDSRDYVKWSCIRHEAGDTLRVVYAPMLCKDSLTGEKLDAQVTRFFNELKDFAALARLFPAGYTFLDDLYTVRSAPSYFDKLERQIHHAQESGPVLVFLDPDTGMESKSTPKDTHLRRRDLSRVCNLLRPGEKTVIYQHASRKKDWRSHWFANLQPVAAETDSHLSEPFHEQQTSKDVCFFTFTKH